MSKPVKNKIFVFAAPSGSGKTSIIKEILSENKNIYFSISSTTRLKREGEADGKDYFFLTENEFTEKINSGEFIEWEKFYDYYYGTPKAQIEQAIKEGKSVILDLDVKGAVNLKKQIPEAVLIFIAPPGIEELKKRLLKRNTESEDDLKKRFERAEFELTFKDKFDKIIINDNLEKAILEAKNIIYTETQWK